jgi:hypothetical protein
MTYIVKHFGKKQGKPGMVTCNHSTQKAQESGSRV